MPGGGSKPAERRGGRQRGTPNKTLTERAQALAAKVAKAEARANAKLVVLSACDPSDGCRKPRAPGRERARAIQRAGVEWYCGGEGSAQRDWGRAREHEHCRARGRAHSRAG